MTPGGLQATWMPRINFALVPLFAWLVSVVRRGSGRRYPRHLFFALHAHAAWLRVAYGITTRRAILDTVIALGLYTVAVIGATLAVICPGLYFWREP